MYNWSTDETELKKDRDKYAIWKLEQMVNFGLDGEKLDSRELKNIGQKLKLIPPEKSF